VPITVAGPAREVPDLPANVTAIGPVDYGRVPGLLQAHAVGLLPFTESELNAGRSPMKLFEYLAAGLYVLGSEFSRSGMGGLPGVTLTRDVPAAAATLRRAVREGSTNSEGRELASHEDWAAKARTLERFLAGLD
jgi:hypothetical protein